MRVQGTGEVGSEQVEGPKVLFEGVPLKAALHQGGRERFADQGVSLATGDPGGSETKGEGDWKVLDRFGTSKTSELKVLVIRMVGGLGGEGTAHGGPRRENSSGRGDKKEGLAGYWSPGDASGSR